MRIARTEAVRRLTWQLRQSERDRDALVRHIRADLDAGGTDITYRARGLVTAGAGVRLYGEAVSLLRGQGGDVDGDDVDYWTAEAEVAEREGEPEVIRRIIDAITEESWVSDDDVSVL